MASCFPACQEEKKKNPQTIHIKSSSKTFYIIFTERLLEVASWKADAVGAAQQTEYFTGNSKYLDFPFKCKYLSMLYVCEHTSIYSEHKYCSIKIFIFLFLLQNQAGIADNKI